MSCVKCYIISISKALVINLSGCWKMYVRGQRLYFEVKYVSVNFTNFTAQRFKVVVIYFSIFQDSCHCTAQLGSTSMALLVSFQSFPMNMKS